MTYIIKAPLRSWESANFDSPPEMTMEQAIVSLAKACVDSGAIHLKELALAEYAIGGREAMGFWERFVVLEED